MAQLPYAEGRRLFPFLRIPFIFSMANVQYPVGQGAPAHAALLVAQEIQPADELSAHGPQAAGGVAQVVQRVDRQEALPAAEHVAQEIQQAAAQVPQQAMEQVQ